MDLEIFLKACMLFCESTQNNNILCVYILYQNLNKWKIEFYENREITKMYSWINIVKDRLFHN